MRCSRLVVTSLFCSLGKCVHKAIDIFQVKDTFPIKERHDRQPDRPAVDIHDYGYRLTAPGLDRHRSPHRWAFPSYGVAVPVTGLKPSGAPGTATTPVSYEGQVRS